MARLAFYKFYFTPSIPVLDYDTPLVTSFLYSVFASNFLLCVFDANLGVAGANLKVGEFLASQKEFGLLYEKHYKFFDKTALDSVKLTQNLIIVIAKSFENTLNSQSIPPQSEAKALSPRVSLSEFYAPL